LIACSGLFSDRVAATCGAPADLRIVPFRGDYYELLPPRAHLCRALIYPVPDPRFPFLGVHFTRLVDGRVLAGPNAVLAFARQGYGRFDVVPRDLADALAWPGFRRMALRYWRTGLAEMWRDYCRKAYVRAMQAYLPAIVEADVGPGPSGVRAQALGRDGALLDDFSFYVGDRMLHVRNAPSPAATSSLAIADAIVEQARSALRLE
jgi:L-2-hydroxyglutarate oxidase LhgO